MLLAQPILIAFLINLSQQNFDTEETVYTFAAVSAVWLGLNNTAREVVRERRNYVRERLLGVSPGGYLTAKILLFGVLGWSGCTAYHHNPLLQFRRPLSAKRPLQSNVN
jgi:hypothetical protein